MSMTISNPRPVRLEPGDRLSREEFHRRYEARPDIKKAELVEGVVYVPSPVRYRQHGHPHTLADFWLNLYVADHPDVEVCTDTTVFLDNRNEPQPDLCMFRTGPGAGLRINDDGYLEGVPDLVVEITASTASYDLGAKKEAYRRNGVPEYVAWRTEDRAIDWFVLRNGVYERLEPDADGIIESVNFPGLRLDVSAMLSGDLARILAALQRTARGV
jgi:Uma2 family endonuclease